MPVDIFGGEEEFKIRQEYDKRKVKYCEDKNIPLLILSYKEIEKLTLEAFKERIDNLWQKE